MLRLDLLMRDLKVAVRSLAHNKGLAITVILTLALGIGANAAIFSVVRGVLLRPLVNRDEDRLIYIRQSAPGLGDENTTFSVPEIQDLQSRVKTLSEFGDFSEMDFSAVGLGAPREVRGGVVDGSYFEVMGLHPVLGRLLDAHDDGPNAAGAVVLTYRFWATVMKKDPTVIGKQVKLDSGVFGVRDATIVGVLEPSVPYPTETEIISNVVTSPHHLSATMVQGRVHRMTELFGRLAPGVTLEQARAESARGVRRDDQPASRSVCEASGLHDQRGAAARPDDVGCKDRAAGAAGGVGTGVHHRGVECGEPDSGADDAARRRTGDSIGAGREHGALRRLLLAESLLLCGAGAALGVLSARPMVAILARYASRFSVRALDLKVDSSMLWVGARLAVVAAVLLAFVPRLPAADGSNGSNLASSSVRITGSTGRRLRVFAVTQIAASFMLLAGAGMLLKTLLSLQSVQTGFDTRNVLAMNVPVVSEGRTPEQVKGFYQEAMRRDRGAAGSGSRGGGDGGAVARRGRVRSGAGIFSGRARAHAGRGGSAGDVSHRIAGIFRGAGSSDFGGPRFR